MNKRLFIICALIAMLFAAVSSNALAAKRISVSGAFALYPLMNMWAEEYRKERPGVIIDVSAGGAGKGAADTLAGMVDIGMVSREPHPDELKRGGLFIPVAKDAVVGVVSSSNPELKQLQKKGVTKEKFTKLWIAGEASQWGKLAGGKSREQVRVYTRSDSCGAAESWANFMGGRQENLKGTGVFGDPGLLEAVRRDPLGIGYNNYSYVFDAKTGKPLPGIMPVPIDVDGNGKIDAAERIDTRDRLRAAIRGGKYPHPPARPLYLMTKGKPAGETKAFILWILAKGQKMVDGAGYLKVPQSGIKKNVKLLNSKK